MLGSLIPSFSDNNNLKSRFKDTHGGHHLYFPEVRKTAQSFDVLGPSRLLFGKTLVAFLAKKRRIEVVFLGGADATRAKLQLQP